MSNQLVPLEDDLDTRVAAFERAWRKGGSADPAAFLPEQDAPHYLEVLSELLRCDMELQWTHGRPRLLDDYRAAFPAAFADSRCVGALAFEEFRQLVRAGRVATPQQYAEMYGLDVSNWPTPDEILRPTYRTYVEPTPSAVAREICQPVQPDRPAAKMPRVGDRFLNFELVSELGRGTFGRVFVARQTNLADRLVALKVAANLGGESDKLARLQHTNIVPIHSVHTVESLNAICMPYFGATTLSDVVRDLSGKSHHLPETGRELLGTLFDSRFGPGDARRTGPEAAPPPEYPLSHAALEFLSRLSHVDAALWIVMRLADGLAHAHERGILHRDLKPANVLIADDGQPMLLDFNVAADANPQSGGARSRIGGTLAYMAPEHLDAMRGGASPVDARSDLFSLGIILFELLTGQAPYGRVPGRPADFIDQLLAQRLLPPPSPRRLNAAVSPAVAAIVLKLLDPDPAKRYASARDLHDDLERQLANRPLAHAPDRSVLERVRKWRRRNPRLATAIAVAAAILVLFVLPAIGVAARQSQIAEHRRAFEQADAQVKQQSTVDELRLAALLLATQTGDRALLEQGRSVAWAALARYGVGDVEPWDQRPSFRLLSPEARAELRQEFGELLWLLARSEQLLSTPDDVQAVSAAMHWNRLAETCFAPDRLPVSLSRQRDELLRLAPGIAEPLAQSDPNPGDEYFDGVDLAIHGRHWEALGKLILFTEQHPQHFHSWYARGISHKQVGQLNDAAAAFTVCIALRNAFPWSYLSRGLVKLEQKRFTAAEADFTTALAKKPDWTMALINRAIAREGRRDWAGADRDLTDALAQSDSPTRIYFLRAKIRRAAGDTAAADRDAAEGMKRTPTDALSWVTRGVWRQHRHPNDALNDFDEALKLNPRSRDAMQNKAVVLADYLNRPKDAVAVMDQLLEMYPTHVEARAGRGVYLARIGEGKRARQDAADTLREEPTAFRLYQMAGLFAQLSKYESDGRDRADALAYLAKGFRAGFTNLKMLEGDTDLDPIRKEPEFQRLVAHVRGLQVPAP